MCKLSRDDLGMDQHDFRNHFVVGHTLEKPSKHNLQVSHPSNASVFVRYTVLMLWITSLDIHDLENVPMDLVRLH